MSKKTCPICGGANISKILWGMPSWTPKLEKDLKSKKVVLGGCCISDCDPTYHCNDCDKGIFYSTDNIELQTEYFEFEIGGFGCGYQKIEIEKTPKKITATYYPAFGEDNKITCIDLNQEEYIGYLHNVYASSLFKWKDTYVDPLILDGVQWGVKVRLFNGENYSWYGSNDYPLSWNKFIDAVNMLNLPEIGIK